MHPALSARLAESGLTPATATRLGLRVLVPATTKQRGFSRDPRLALEIPYHDAQGKPIGFSRVRFLDKAPGFGAFAQKGQRYSQQKDSGVHVYFPRSQPWSFLSQDPNARSPGDVLITEGELKAAAGCQAGFPTLGLGGVWSFRDRASLFLPALDALVWQDRRVYIVYDSDVRAKLPVRQALLALSEQLHQRGARPYEVILEAQDDGQKQGLDDFLLAQGVRALAQLMIDAPEYRISHALRNGWADRFVIVGDQSAIFDRSKSIFYSAGNFQTLFQDQRIVIPMPTARGLVPKEVPLPKAWLRWPLKLRADTMDILPDQPAFVIQDGHTILNRWQGWGVPSVRGGIEPWRKLLHGLFEDAEREALVERWIAWQVQNPGRKISWAVLVWDALSGTGKSFLGYVMGGLFGKGFQEIKAEELFSDFNGHLHGTQLVMVDELGKSEKRRESAYLKTAISRQTILVNEKFQKPYTVPDRCNYYLTSNEPDPVNVDAFDRRLFVHQVKRRSLDPAWLQGELHRWAHEGDPLERHRGKGIAALRYHLERVDVSSFNAFTAPPMTDDKRQLVRAASRGVDVFVAELLEGSESLERDLFTAPELAVRARDVLHEPISTQALSRALRRAGCQPVNRGNLVAWHSGRTTIWALRRQEHWAKQDHKSIVQYLDAHTFKSPSLGAIE